MSFRTCSNCGVAWETREAFLGDPGISLVGYQVYFERLLEGHFMFNHTCRTTLALPAGRFRDLYDGPVFFEENTGSDTCPGYCLYSRELRPCPEKCECAFVREIVQIVRAWPKDRP